MDSVTLDGVVYVKASVVAKSFRYTSDYIGQLCRSKKVDARLVGRTWFVNVDSVKLHRQNKYKTPNVVVKKDTTIDSDIAKEIKVSRVEVQPVVNPKTIKIVNEMNVLRENSRFLKVFYDRDEEALMPTLTKKRLLPPQKIRVELASAKKVRIAKSKSNPVSFEAGELPEVALSGALKVTTFVDPEPEQVKKEEVKSKEKKAENKDISSIQDTSIVPEKTPVTLVKPKPSVEKIEKGVVLKVREKGDPKAKKSINKVKLTKVIAKQSAFADKLAVTPDDNLVLSPATFIPSVVKHVELEIAPSVLVRLSPLFATLLAILFVVGIFSAGYSVVVLGSEHESRVVFQVANLMEIFRR